MDRLEIIQIPVLDDNYVYLLRDRAGTAAAVVDPAVGEPVLAEAQRRGWRLTQVLNTHWHPDHVGANLMLKEATGCAISGPAGEQDKIPGIDRAVAEGDTIAIGQCVARVLDVPGHTAGHVAYHFAQDQALFCGDTLFALGCGRIFEGTPAQMWASLSKLAALPDETAVYCAHEYTLSNGAYALHAEPGNAVLAQRMDAVRAARAAGQPTVPSRLGDEKRTNPFLLAGDAGEFARRRAEKDGFRG